MNKALQALLCLAAQLPSPAWGQDASWFPTGTAFVGEKDHQSVGVFAPLQFGLGKSYLLSTHPLLFVFAPNAAVIRQVKRAPLPANHALALEGSLALPTWLLRALAREGIGGLFPPPPPPGGEAGLDRSLIPFLVAGRIGALGSRQTWGRGVLSAGLGARFAVPLAARRFDPVDHPALYARSAVYATGGAVDALVTWQAPIGRRWSYLVAARGFFLPWAAGHWAGEHYLKVRWRLTDRMELQAGYLFFFANLPFGLSYSPLLPLADVTWTLP